MKAAKKALQRRVDVRRLHLKDVDAYVCKL
jgi:hypothetical protein